MCLIVCRQDWVSKVQIHLDRIVSTVYAVGIKSQVVLLALTRSTIFLTPFIYFFVVAGEENLGDFKNF
jgi:hypothetical protein